jgi:hypothetical protein
VKWRELSLRFGVPESLGARFPALSGAAISLSGRNLKTWTDYSGLDPESNLTGQSLGRGIDYFNNPRTRSFVFGVNLSR